MTGGERGGERSNDAETGGGRPNEPRLYGRVRGHALRARQRRLLAETLPRMRFAHPAEPRAGFGRPVDAVWLEVGSGGGEHAQALAAANPGIGLVACEVFENGLCSLLGRLVPAGGEAGAPLPPNLRLWPEDARRLLRALPEACLDKLLLMFPDPWPKTRHADRRFVHPTMLEPVARVIAPGGEWRIATDDPTYQDWVRATLAAQRLFAAAPPADAPPPGWPATRYQAKAARAGRRALYWRAVRTQVPVHGDRGTPSLPARAPTAPSAA